MAKYNRPNGKLFGSSATNIGVFGSGQQNETPATSTDPNTINGLGTHWEQGWDGAVVSQAPYTAPYVEDMNAVNYVNSYNSAYLLQRGIPEYSATEEYQEDSVCTYNGEIWICLQDNTVGQTPSEGTYWHLQGEVPVMDDNEILVGAVGGTPTVVDTNAQGDILASAFGLNIKANTIVNADVNASAGIVESKLSLDYATSTLNSDIGTVSGNLTTHTSNTSNPHSVTKAQVLSGDPIVNADVDASAGIEESKLTLDYSTSSLNTAITTHTGDTANPHSTKIANLGDVALTTPINDKDVINWDSVSQKFVNSAPLGDALSTLSDVTLTSPTDKQLVQYDYANSKWVNSSEVWDTIEVNDIAYVGATPQGRSLDGNNNVTMLITDNRHQIFTATDGFNITLPSTGIKAGEKFVFEWTQDFLKTITTAFSFYSSDNTLLAKSWNQCFVYTFTALANNPTSNSDWLLKYTRNIHYDIYMTSQNTTSISMTGVLKEGYGTSFFTLPRGIWTLNLHQSISVLNINYSSANRIGIRNSSDSSDLTSIDGNYMRVEYGNSEKAFPSGIGNARPANINISALYQASSPISFKAYYRLDSSSSWSTSLYTWVFADLRDPYIS